MEIVLYTVVGIALAWGAVLWFLRKIWFYRDPVRQPPEDPDLILAPCDGKVVYIRRIEQGKVECEKLGRPIEISEITHTDWDKGAQEGQGWLIGIYMSPLDVHYNYAPIAGAVEKIHKVDARVNLPMVDLWEYVNLTYFRRAMDLLGKRYQLENERQTIFLQGEKVKLAMVEIADKYVNKITTYIQEGQVLRPAQKVSFIERGSQVDLAVFSTEVEILCKVGDQTAGGVTPLLRALDKTT